MKATYYDHYLTDRDVANIARQSFDARAEDYSEEANNRLIEYLARGMPSGDYKELLGRDLTEDELNAYRRTNTHWVPFGHPGITLRMSAPVPIRTQCFKSKSGFVESEESRRYISSTPELFIPKEFRSAAENVKQGSAGKMEDDEEVKFIYTQSVNNSLNDYLLLIDKGLCPEQARFVLPQAAEVKWVWTGSLMAYARFARLRLDDTAAQKEVAELAEEVHQIIAPLFPVSWAALSKY